MVKIQMNKYDSWREEYAKVIASERWQTIVRPKMLEWAKNKCERCGAGENLQVHHLTYRRLGSEKPDDLLVLCERCHEIAERYRELLSFEKFLYKTLGPIEFKEKLVHSIFSCVEF